MLISIKDKNIEGVEIKDSINSMLAWSLVLVNAYIPFLQIKQKILYLIG